MKKQLILIVLLIVAYSANSQSAKDLFSSSTKISWLGIDYSHVKLMGDFSQFSGAGEKNTVEIKNQYFPAWNRLILNEPEKYDIKGMLNKESITNDIDMIMEINSKTDPDALEASQVPNYSKSDIDGFVKAYNTEGKEGIGVALIAECYNKYAEEAVYHFVAINMQTKEILIYEKMIGKPGGIGIRNYWAGSIYSIIKQIKKPYYKEWSKKYS